MRVAFNDHLFRQFHAAQLGNSPHIIASQIDQHQMLSDFLGIIQQLVLQRLILRRRGTALARTGDGPDGHLIVFQPHQNLWRGAHHLMIIQVQIIHVG